MPSHLKSDSRVLGYTPRVGFVADTLARVLFAITNDAFGAKTAHGICLIFRAQPAGSQIARVRAFAAKRRFSSLFRKLMTKLVREFELVFPKSTCIISRKFGFAAPLEFDDRSAFALAKGLVGKSARKSIASPVVNSRKKPSIPRTKEGASEKKTNNRIRSTVSESADADCLRRTAPDDVSHRSALVSRSLHTT